jgi:uncharacterized protein (DUF2252 family)
MEDVAKSLWRFFLGSPVIKYVLVYPFTSWYTEDCSSKMWLPTLRSYEMKKKKMEPTPNKRQPVLEARRRLKMARSAHAYVRGNTLKFYEWLESSGGKMPDGPPIWICGDCHVGNLGPVANMKGRVEIEIRDMDQTVIGNPAHDLVRLGLSLATAARGSDLPGVTTAKMLEQMMVGYGHALAVSDTGKQSELIAEPVQPLMKEALHRKWRHLAAERIDDVRPEIPRGSRFWSLTRKEMHEIHQLFRTDEAHRLITCLHNRKNSAEVSVLDAAYWMKGCSSLGRLRYAVLLQVGDGDHRNGGLCLMDIKEAICAAAPRAVRARMPRDNAQRVVEGARNLSPFLGGRMMASHLGGRTVFLRELLPQDLKLELDRITCKEAETAARFLAEVVGKAHGRQMDAATREKWSATLKANRSKTLDAPSWLWSCVIELIASHEAGYLEHCRRYAMGEA